MFELLVKFCSPDDVDHHVLLVKFIALRFSREYGSKGKQRSKEGMRDARCAGYVSTCLQYLRFEVIRTKYM